MKSEYKFRENFQTGLPTILTNKIHSNLYKKYKKETGREPWQLTKAVIVSTKLQTLISITYEAKPNPELIIRSVLDHFTYMKFRNSYRGIDNYNFAFAQLWDSSCPICNGKHGNYGLHGEWYKNYKNGTEYCLTCNSSSNKLKFAIVA